MRTADTQSIVCARKGSYDLIEAFKALPNVVRARARLVFAGDRQVEDLRELASEYQDPVTVHSWINRDQRDQLRADSDVFVRDAQDDRRRIPATDLGVTRSFSRGEL